MVYRVAMRSSLTFLAAAFVLGACTSTVGPEGDARSDAPVNPCPGSTPCYRDRVLGTHAGTCPSVVYLGTACADRCLICTATSPSGGPWRGDCVCNGTVWTCASDSGIGCAFGDTCWMGGAPPVCM